MKRFLALMVLGMLTAPAAAHDGLWYAKGEMQTPNQWSNDNVMTDLGGGHWTTTIGGLFSNADFQFKLARNDWSESAPTANSKVTTDALGAITFHMWDQTSWSDGWLPNNNRRIGYNDPLQYGWELVGSFNGWPGANDPNYNLTPQGNGVYSGQFTFTPGTYDFKFRKQGSWDVNYSKDFGHDPQSNLNQVIVTQATDVWQFDLDLPNGRLRAFNTNVYGDYNGDGDTDAADYVVWRNTMAGNTPKYNEWRSNFGRKATWIAHGSFGADVTLTDQGGGHFTTTLTGLTTGNEYDVQVLRSDSGAQFPGSPAKITANASGNIDLHFYKLAPNTTWSDASAGWQPSNASRVGYADSQQFDWEIVGGFNGWPGANDPAFKLTDQGNGLHTGSFVFNTTGTFPFKFRRLAETNPWSTSIGPDFGNSGGDNSFTVATAGQTWNFELDLLNGRWRTYIPSGSGLGSGAVPEPASVALLLFGVALMSLNRRRDIV